MSFSVDQYIHMAETHRQGLQRTSKQPRCLITVFPGLFDNFLADRLNKPKDLLLLDR